MVPWCAIVRYGAPNVAREVLFVRVMHKVTRPSGEHMVVPKM